MQRYCLLVYFVLLTVFYLYFHQNIFLFHDNRISHKLHFILSIHCLENQDDMVMNICLYRICKHMPSKDIVLK
jgi:hypothetical protein